MFAKSIDKSRELITVDVNGWPVHYRSFVKPRNAYKTPIVCLAGLFENDESLVKSLEKVFVTNPVYLVYMPGFLNNDEVGEELTYAAYSMLLNSFISSLGIDSCHLISHSYTANIAIFFVDHFADRVTNITFISPVTQMRDSVKYIANQNIRSINEGNQKAFAARESLNYVPTFSDGSSHEVKNLVKEHYLNILNPENKLGEKYRAHIERLSRFTEESVFIKGVKNCPVTVVSG
jgi:pimeloyl-ACP methyl ester carboxylesterase